MSPLVYCSHLQLAAPAGRWPLAALPLGGRGSGGQKFVYDKGPNQIFPTVNFVVSHGGPFGLGGGGGGEGGAVLLRWLSAVVIHPWGRPVLDWERGR